MKNAWMVLIVCFLYQGCNNDSIDQAVIEGEGRITAAYRYAEIQSLALSYEAGSRFFGIGSDEVNYDGTAAKWSYYFLAGGTPPTLNCFNATYDGVAFDSNTALNPGPRNISHNWVNSDMALLVAEQNGGREFRNGTPNFTISASLGEPLVPDAKTCWYITYRSKENGSRYLSLTIDASDGTVIRKYSS
jgi:hypothetical protein